MEETHSILHRALGGDSTARNLLFERVRHRLVVWIHVRLSPRLRALVEPEDVAQEVLLAAHRALDGLRSEEMAAFHRWIFRIAEHRICDLADHFGARKRQPHVPVIPTQATPGTLSIRSEQMKLVLEAIERLPEDYRTVLKLRLLEGVEVQELVEIMDRSPNAIRLLVMRARRALGDELDGKV